MGKMKVSDIEGKALLAYAKKVIEARLSGEGEVQLPREVSHLIEKRATFVTLKKEGKLRGCIGSLVAQEPLYKNVAVNAVNAAFHDMRFGPLTRDEAGVTELELSILSVPEVLQYSGAEELLELLRPGIDGVILRYQGKTATFLPQVWEQLPVSSQFLTHLCSKAGLDGRSWENGDVEILIYQVQSFKEDKK